MIQIMASKWTANPPILRDGHEFGTLIRGLAYVQGATARELREVADRMDEMEAGTTTPDVISGQERCERGWTTHCALNGVDAGLEPGRSIWELAWLAARSCEAAK